MPGEPEYPVVPSPVRMVHRLSGRRPVHFLHIGKTGGTALRCALRRRPVTRRYYLVFHPHKIRLRDIPPGEAVVFFVRDPLTRFVSGFYSRRRQGLPRLFSPWNPGEAEAFERFQTADSLAQALSAADRGEREAAERAMRSIQHVRDSYWYWFESEAYLRSRQTDVFFVGRQETLAADFQGLKQLLETSPDLALPDDDVSAHRNPADIDKRLDEDAVRNLQAWYRDEYRFLEICRVLFGV